MPGIEGLDLPPREVLTKRSPGMDGERLVEVRTLSREVFLPLFVASDSSHLAYLERRDGLRRLFNYRSVDYRAAGGTFDLVAESARGARSLRCVFVEGMSGVKAPDEGGWWAKLGLTLRAVNPYWEGDRWQTPIIRQESGVSWFGAFPGRLASSYTFGTFTVPVPGDAESPVTVDLVGPATSVTITGPGLLVSIPGGLASGETARIVTDPRGRTALFGGVVDWARVGPVSTWAPLPPGDRTLSIVVAGVGATTQAQVSGPTRYDAPW